MSIKYRLILSYIGMIVIPIILIILLNFTFSLFVVDDSENIVDLIKPGKKMGEYIENNMDIGRRLNIALIDGEEYLINNSYIKSLEDKLQEFHAGLLIRKDDEILYVTKEIKDLVKLDELPSFKEEYSREKYMKFDEGYIVGYHMDYYLNGAKISVFGISNVIEIRKEIRKSSGILTITTIFILILTTLALTYSIYTDIMKSIKKLRHAANEMKNGNLDYEIKRHLNDEIGELSLAFEEMRLKLKYSLEVQKKYEENRKNLISNISHDLKTPIMSIKGHIEGIKDGIAHSPEKMEKYIDTIYEKSKDMELLINELFLFSSLDLEKESFDFQVIDIIEFLEYSVEDLSFDLEKVDGKIDLKYDCESVFVEADLQKLKRVVLNIVSNAIKYRKEEPLVVDINVKKLENEVVVEIKDNGKGISRENLHFIFDRFYRGDKSRNTSIVGSGLGLAISKQIIEKHGGRIWARSKRDVGTSIFFSLKEYEGGEKSYEKDINY